MKPYFVIDPTSLHHQHFATKEEAIEYASNVAIPGVLEGPFAEWVSDVRVYRTIAKATQDHDGDWKMEEV